MFNYGFFNSVNGDRVYNADTMSSIFEGLITDGVFYGVGDKMAVQPNSGMTIQIASGRGWFNKRWAVNTTPYLLTLEASDVTLNRYAAVVIKVDSSESVRSVAPYIKYSQYATNPVKPTMTRSETVNEYCLAYVYIGAGVTAITSANIEDARADENVCGWVTGLIDQLDSNTLFTQFTAIFNEWFSGLQDDLNPNTEAMLVAALPQSLTVKLSPSGWNMVDNKIPYPYYDGTITRNGVTFTVNDDGTIKVNGTATADATFNIDSRTDNVNLTESGKRYKFVGCPSGGATTTYRLSFYEVASDKSTQTLYVHDTGNGASFTSSEHSYTCIVLWVKSGTTVNNLVFKPMLVEADVFPTVSYDDYKKYVQSVTVAGMNDTKSIIVTPAQESEEAYNTANVRGSSQSTNTLTFHCDELPTEQLTVQVLHLGQ